MDGPGLREYRVGSGIVARRNCSFIAHLDEISLATRHLALGVAPADRCLDSRRYSEFRPAAARARLSTSSRIVEASR